MRRVTGVTLPAPSVGLGVSLGLPLVGLEAVGQVAVGLGRVAWEDTGLMHDLAASHLTSMSTHGLVHSPAEGRGGGDALLRVGHVTLLKDSPR